MSRTGRIDINAAVPAQAAAADATTAQSIRRQTSTCLLVHETDANAAMLDVLWTRADELISNGRMIKDGDRCTVALAEFDGVPMVVKRYNLRDRMHTARHWFLRSRARWSWLNGRQLRDGGLRSPRPLAYIEERNGPCRGRSFLMTDYQPGRTLFDVIHADGVSDEQLTAFAEQFAHIWRGLGRMRIGHGDMKATNFIVDEDDRLWLVDLDAMRTYPPGIMLRNRRDRDLARFMRNWESKPAVAAAFRDMIRTDETPAS